MISCFSNVKNILKIKKFCLKKTPLFKKYSDVSGNKTFFWPYEKTGLQGFLPGTTQTRLYNQSTKEDEMTSLNP